MNNQLKEECKKYLGLPPYNDSGNICKDDWYTIHSLKQEYGEDAVTQCIEELQNKRR